MGRNKLARRLTLTEMMTSWRLLFLRAVLLLLLTAEIKREISPCRDEIKSLKSEAPPAAYPAGRPKYPKSRFSAIRTTRNRAVNIAKHLSRNVISPFSETSCVLLKLLSSLYDAPRCECCALSCLSSSPRHNAVINYALSLSFALCPPSLSLSGRIFLINMVISIRNSLWI